MAWLVWIGLVVVTSLYAWLLERYKHLVEPDLTWAEVIVGVIICLGAVRWYAALQPVPLTGVETEIATVIAFVVGGSPIVIWQVWRMIRRRTRRDDVLRNGEVQ